MFALSRSGKYFKMIFHELSVHLFVILFYVCILAISRSGKNFLNDLSRAWCSSVVISFYVVFCPQ